MTSDQIAVSVDAGGPARPRLSALARTTLLSVPSPAGTEPPTFLPPAHYIGSSAQKNGPWSGSSMT